MAIRKIKDFTAGERMNIPLLVKEVKNGTTAKGAAYLTLTLQDSSGLIDGKFWDVRKEDVDAIHVGHVEAFNFEVLDYNHNLQLRINKVVDLDQSTVPLEEYVISSRIPEAERRRTAEDYINSIENPRYRRLVKEMLKLIGDKYYNFPAASRIHHNYLGGLSEHSLSMAALASSIAELYPQLNRDLLIAGVLVHDVGKTAEMSGPVTTEYTLEGKLEGHISLANGWLSEVAEATGLAGTEEAVLLHHMILSHHGHYEFGSPVLPMVQEAEVLYLIDNMDARLNTLRQALDETDPGTWTQKLFSLDNRQFYKPKGEE